MEIATILTTLTAIGKIIGPKIADYLITKAMEKTTGKLWGLKKP